ncbi:MAG: tetratricopeptide repeat protein, partial [Xanthomonadales bacterium]|nr:tetratricopeptide repeat protein [Xanthomonadales bacterium]
MSRIGLAALLFGCMIWAQSQAATADSPALAVGNTARADQLQIQIRQALEQLRLDDADALGEQLRELAAAEQQPLWLATADYYAGVAARRGGQTERALAYFESSLKLRQQHDDKPGQVASLNALATLHRRAGSLYQALDEHTRALQLAREVGVAEGIAGSLAKIGRIYAELDDLNPSADYYRQALDALDPDEVIERADILCDLGGIYVLQGKLEDAVAAVDQAVQLAEDS